VLQNNTGDDLPIAADGPFTFATKVATGSPYAVTVKTPPATPTQVCTVTNGTGTMGSAAVSNVNVTCAVASFAVGGMVSGLSGTVVLQNNTGDDLTVNANGAFAFPAKIASGANYAVTVKTQPGAPKQTCTVSQGSGTVTNAAITNVAVECTTDKFTVGGNITGLQVGSVVLQNNLADDLTRAANGPFTFATSIASGANYAVTVKTQPPGYTCAVTTGSGTIAAANVANVAVACNPTVPGLVGYYPFNGDAKDYSGNARDVSQIVGATLTTDRFGNANKAYAFAGNQYMTAPGGSLPIGDVVRTLTYWVKRDPAAPGIVGLIHWGNGDCTGKMFGSGYSGGMFVWGGCRDASLNTQLLVDNTWTFVALVYKGSGAFRSFVGANAGVDGSVGAALDTQASKLWIGGESTNDTSIRNSFRGAIDSIRIYNRALTDQEVDAIRQTND
jgi:hypothetical protein